MENSDALNTKQAIQREFIRLYSKKDYNSITIKELCIQTPIARTTFYTYYKNIDELKTEIETSLLSGLNDITYQFNGKNLALIDLHEFLKYSMQYIQNNWDAVYAFLITQPNVRFIDLWKADIKKHFKMHYPHKRDSSNYELLSEVVASSAIQCYCYWMQHPDEVDDEKLFEMVQSSISSMIHAL